MNSNNAQMIANVGSFIRLGLMLVAGPLLKEGIVDGATLDLIAGALATVVVAGWVVYKNWKTHQNTVTVAGKAAIAVGAPQSQIDEVKAAAKAGTL